MRFLNAKEAERKKILEEDLNRKSIEVLFHAHENGSYHYSYKEEKKLFEAIKSGMYELAKTLMEELYLHGYVDKRYDSIRNVKNLSVIMVTLISRAAIEGGVPEETAFAQSETYMDIIECCKSKDDIVFVQDFCLYDFTKKVKAYRQRNYSDAINECINYIQRHIHEKITAEDLAEITEFSTRQLARKFKNELSCTINEYIQEEKINAAKRLLEFSEHSILEIGYLLDFCSQSYFIRIFKKYEGMTPAQFRLDKKKMRNS
jgi:AraC-like DNA-binding protein